MSENKKGGMGEIVNLIVVLGLITLICALLLGVVNQVTAPKIAENQAATRNLAMAEIIPGAEFTDLQTTVDGEVPITGVYEAVIGGETVGYCVEVTPSGFGGALTMIVGINADGTVAGAKVNGHAETPGLGAKAQSDWINQYAGAAADGSLAVTKDGGTIASITGATITSRAVTAGVNTAANYVASLG